MNIALDQKVAVFVDGLGVPFLVAQAISELARVTNESACEDALNHLTAAALSICQQSELLKGGEEVFEGAGRPFYALGAVETLSMQAPAEPEQTGNPLNCGMEKEEHPPFSPFKGGTGARKTPGNGPGKEKMKKGTKPGNGAGARTGDNNPSKRTRVCTSCGREKGITAFPKGGGDTCHLCRLDGPKKPFQRAGSLAEAEKLDGGGKQG